MPCITSLQLTDVIAIGSALRAAGSAFAPIQDVVPAQVLVPSAAETGTADDRARHSVDQSPAGLMTARVGRFLLGFDGVAAPVVPVLRPRRDLVAT